MSLDRILKLVTNDSGLGKAAQPGLFTGPAACDLSPTFHPTTLPYLLFVFLFSGNPL